MEGWPEYSVSLPILYKFSTCFPLVKPLEPAYALPMALLIFALVWALSCVAVGGVLRGLHRRTFRMDGAHREAMSGIRRVLLDLERHSSALPAEFSEHMAEVLEAIKADDDRDLPEWRAGLERKMDLLTLAVSEGIERVDRAERRIRTAVAGATKKLREAGFEDVAVEAEAAGLRVIDGGGGDEGGVPPVSEDVGGADEPSSVPGVSRNQLLRARGINV